MKKILLQLMLFTLISSVNAQEVPVIKDVFKNYFLIGTAVNASQFNETDSIGAAVIRNNFNSITPENILKWEQVHPVNGKYNFTAADNYVKFGIENKMFIIGHTLVWHGQTPKWVFESAPGVPATRDQLIERMRDHIFTVVGRYKGKISGWDVVNEALNEDGTLRESPWKKIIGDDFIELAFRFAHEADPDAKLFYNDYSIENKPKREGTIKLFKNLKSKGIYITGIGIQEHVKMDWPSPGLLDSTINEFASAGADVMITELDVDVLPSADNSNSADINLNFEKKNGLNPYSEGLPDSLQNALAKRYKDLFNVYVKNSSKISRVTLWGATDKDSWLNNWPIRGRTSFPLLFDRKGKPKKAYYSVIGIIENKNK
jgi:endo-1,4-beta-xylanase